MQLESLGYLHADCVSLKFNLHPMVLICVSLNPRCPTDFGRSLRVSEPEHPVTPTKHFRNDGASRADPDPEDPFRLSDEEEGLGARLGHHTMF